MFLVPIRHGSEKLVLQDDFTFPPADVKRMWNALATKVGYGGSDPVGKPGRQQDTEEQRRNAKRQAKTGKSRKKAEQRIQKRMESHRAIELECTCDDI